MAADAERLSKIVELARTIEERANESLPLAELASMAGLSPSRLQRVFKEVLGVSPKTYQEAVRMRRFKTSLKDSATVTDAIFSAGFGSISRIYGEEDRQLGMSPKSYKGGAKGEMIVYACRDTSLGLIAMAATERGVCFVEFGDTEDSLVAALDNEFPNAELLPSSAGTAPQLESWMNALEAHITVGAPNPDIPLDMRGTAFQIQVWQFLTSIREGEIRSYGQVAEAIGKPSAIRAVASACARNRIGLLIPCHRVLRADGQLGGYRWGLERKRALLAAERAQNAEQ